MELLLIVLTLQLLVACHGQFAPCGNEVRISPPSQTVRIGSDVTITCHLQTSLSGNVSFLWHFWPANVSTSEPSLLVLENSQRSFPQPDTLLITNVTSSNLGSYACEKLNEPSCISNASVLALFEKAVISVTPKQNNIYSAGTVNLTAEVTGNPLPATITIEKQDIQTGDYIVYPKTKYSVTDLRTISIPNLSLEDNGEYRACVANSHDSVQCDRFTIVVTGLKLIPPVATIKNGSSLSIACRIVNYFGNLEMVWETASGSDLTNDTSVQVTQQNNTDLHLFVESVTETVAYSCVLRSSLGITISESIRVVVTDVPGPPRNLNIQSTGSDGVISITWIAPETDNFSPLTAYYVNITVEGTNSSTVRRVLSSITNAEYLAKCKVINVSVTSENACGNSTAVEFGIDTRNQCEASVAESSQSDDSNALAIIVAGIVVVVLFVGLTVLVIVIFFILFKRQKRELKHVPSLKDAESQPNVKAKSHKSAVTSSPPPFIKRTTSIRRYRSMLEVPKDHVQLRDFLCDGTYFELRKALLTIPENDNKTHEVMVKKAKQSAPSEEEHNIQEEIKMMSSVGVHENVVGLIRTCLSEPPAYLITEYFAHGDLLGFLRASRSHYGMYSVSPGTGYKTHPCSIQGQDLLKMVTQVAAGMSYLAEKKVTHRSLCARNVLVATGLQVKVYNYGQKADSEAVPHNYIKWMAPEMLFDGTANTMSDVWSFAVTFWEIITIGGSPYPTTHPEQMRELLQTGHRLPKPDHCADALYAIMEQCWKMERSARSTFTMLHKQLDAMCKSKLSYLDSSLYREEEYSEFEETNQLMTAL